MATQRGAIDTPLTLTGVFYVGETATDPGGATATVTVTRPDGTAIATAAATTRTGAGTFTYALAAQTNPTRLKALWTGTDGRKVTTWVDVVGAVYAELVDIRALEGIFDNSVMYTTAVLELARAGAEAFIEDVTATAWVPRFARERHAGDATSCLVLDHVDPRQLISVTIDGIAVSDLSGFAFTAHGTLEWSAGTFTEPTSTGENVVIEYLHGKDEPPEDLRRACLRLIRHLVVATTSRFDERAISVSADGMVTQLATAGRKRPTGLPDVDAILARYTHRLPGLA